MQITPINVFQNNYNKPSFGVNVKSPRLEFKHDDFYIHIKGYGKNFHWVEKIKETADKAVNSMRSNHDFELVLRKISDGVYQANQFCAEYVKQIHTGILRTARKGWNYGSDWQDASLITRYDCKQSKYRAYYDRLEKIVKKPLKNPYRKLKLTIPIHEDGYGKFLEHADEKCVNQALDMVSNLYKELFEKYIQKEPTAADLQDINSKIAEIRWILAHSTPWERGSDAISNTFMRAIYKAIGIKSYPLKRGVSLDLEAYCTNLDEYKKNFASYFARKPELVD